MSPATERSLSTPTG